LTQYTPVNFPPDAVNTYMRLMAFRKVSSEWKFVAIDSSEQLAMNATHMYLYLKTQSGY
jgi:hypothetical protein